MTRRAVVAALTLVALVSSAVTGLSGASAVQPAQATVVSAVPQAGTPQIVDGAVYAIAQVGQTMVVGGSFTRTGSADPQAPFVTPYVMAFDAVTGAVRTAFQPRLDGNVQTVLPGPVPGTVYVGGVFRTAAGTPARKLLLLNLADGSRVTSFAMPPTDPGSVQAVRRVGNRLYVGGSFTTVGGVAHAGIVTLDATTGALDPFMASGVTLNHSWTPTSPTGTARAPVGIYKLDVSPDGTKLVGVGNFRRVDGVAHDQVAMWDLTGPTARLRDWGTTRMAAVCNAATYDSDVRDVGFSPDGTYFAIVNTGGSGPAGALCDSASRWETAATGQDAQPTWVDYTGKDSLLSVVVTGQAVYVGGHQRWLNNGLGADAPGPGAVPRPGVAALDPANGLPLSWNPGRSPRGAGTWVLYATPTGLWMGSDTDYVGNYRYRRAKLAFFPLAGGRATVPGSVPVLPGLLQSGSVPAAPPSGVLHRINAGGPLLQSTDAGPDWAADTATTSPYRNSGSSVAVYGSPVRTVDATVPAGTPTAVFADERWDPGTRGDGQEMQWQLPVAAGTSVEVRLLFANRCTCTAATGARTFDVAIDGVVKVVNLDVYASAGDQTGTMRSWTVTSDGSVDITFTHGTDAPDVSALEVVPAGSGTHPVGSGTVASRRFDGTTAGPATAVTSPLDVAAMRGATVVGGSLVYGGTDGELHSRTVSGGTYGPDTLLDPYDDPAWATVATGSGGTYRGTRPGFHNQISNLTSLMYDGKGRLFYTLYKQSGLYSRAFTLDSGVVHHDEVQVAGGALPDVTGAFLSGNTLYYVGRADGNLSRTGFDGSRLVGTATVVSGPTRDGIDWRSRLLYLAPQNQPPVAAAGVSCTDLACSADSAGSADPDGQVTAASWAWGDGTSSRGMTATHTYAAGGSYDVVLTVTDDRGATGSTTRPVMVAPHVNMAPSASFLASCDLTSCAVDGSASSDTDGSVASWAWSFGDGTTASRVTATHVFRGAGSYPVTLTVTDDAGARSSVTRQVSVQARPTSPIAFRGAGSVSNASATLLTVAVPAGVQTGDALLLKVSTSGTGSAPTPQAGWAEVTRRVAGTSLTVLWQRVATAQDSPGTTVQVRLASAVTSTAQVLAYTGTAATSPVSAAASAADAALTTTHTAPPVRVPTSGSWVLWFWTDKSSTTTSWTQPAGVTPRAASYGSGTGYLTTVMGDEGAARPAGTAPARTATTDAPSRAASMSVVLAPAAP